MTASTNLDGFGTFQTDPTLSKLTLKIPWIQNSGDKVNQIYPQVFLEPVVDLNGTSPLVVSSICWFTKAELKVFTDTWDGSWDIRIS